MKKGTDVAVRLPQFYIVHQNLPGKRTGLHAFPEHILFIPLSGEVRLRIKREELSLGPGFMAYIPPNAAHEFDSSDHAGERLIVMFETELDFKSTLPKKLPVSHLIKEITFYLLTHPKTKSRRSLCNVLTQTLIEIMDANRMIESTQHILGKVQDARLKLAIQTFETRFSENLKIDEVARIAGLSARNFTRLLVQETGFSPKQLLINLRIDEAKQLLAAGASVLEAANAVGYYSLSQFIAAFRSRTGSLPSKFSQVG